MSIKKIAEMTGASVSTVGRVLNDPDHKCSSEELKRRIFQAAREICYVPNESARNLRSGNISQKNIYYINIMISGDGSNGQDPFVNEVLRLTEIEIRKRNSIVANIWHSGDLSDEKYCASADVENEIYNMYKDNQTKSDGLIVLGECCEKGLKILKKYEKNLILITRCSNDLNCDRVFCSGRKIAETVMNYLVRLGHKKIGYVGNCRRDPRFSGFQAAQIKFDIDSNIDYVFNTFPDEKQGYMAMEYFFKLEDPPTAIYCANDILAVGMLKFLSKRYNKLYFPSIIGSDDIAESRYTKPMLTTVSLPKADMVRLGLMLLLDRIQGCHKTAVKLEIEPSLVIRESCNPVYEMNEPEYYI